MAKKEQEKIPTTKVQRATRFVKTGVRVGGNYMKYYAKKAVKKGHTRDELDQANARDIYNGLSELKGSALKMAQMMSMDRNVLPRAYTDLFSQAQYSAPPLSYPLVVKTFDKYFGKAPTEVFETFSRSAVNAASIGQVHEAFMDGKRLAVKVQYPGVGDSVRSDLKMVKPIAARMFGIKVKEMKEYFEEVETMMLEETDYELELKRSIKISKACKHLEGLRFPKYYKKLSSKRILTMDWLPGEHLGEFMQQPRSQELINRIGQRIWDFYEYQVHTLRTVHADPHPGNFLFEEDGTVGILDFGCVKEIPDDFYQPFFKLLDKDKMEDPAMRLKLFKEAGLLNDADSESQVALMEGVFTKMISLLGKPFHTEEFDFSDDAYFKEIAEFGEKISKMKQFRKAGARGSADGIYVNRAYFGLYSILNLLGAKVKTGALSPVKNH